MKAARPRVVAAEAHRFWTAPNKARVLAQHTAHALRLNHADVLALNKAPGLRLNSNICPYLLDAFVTTAADR